MSGLFLPASGADRLSVLFDSRKKQCDGDCEFRFAATLLGKGYGEEYVPLPKDCVDGAIELPDCANAIARREAWFGCFRFWKGLSWILSVSIAAGSAFVASGLSVEHHLREYFALAVAVCAALQTALSPARRADAYREAWIGLDLAVHKHCNMAPGLLEAIRVGENRIGDTHAPAHKVG